MTLDVKEYEPTREWQNLEEPLVVFDNTETTLFPTDSVKKTADYQFRYVVHRQYVGFFTPVVFDVHFDYFEVSNDSQQVKINLNKVAEAFIEGALFMNHTSSFIIDMLKGQEAGYDRKILLEDIRTTVSNINTLWYSDWSVPPLTRQSQRIVIYDMEVTGSMLDPVNVLKQFPTWLWSATRCDLTAVYKAEITAGYTQKTV